MDGSDEWMLQRADGAFLPVGGTGDAARAEALPLSTGVDDLGRFFELSEDLLCLAGFDGYFQRLSPSWSDLLGFTLDELTAVPFNDFVHPDDRDRTASQFAEQVAQGLKAIRFENRYRHRDGSYRSLSWNATPDEERGLVYAVARWIDPQIDAERAVRESEAFSAAVLAASPDAIVVDELEGGASVYASKTAAELFGTTEDGANIGLLASAAHTEDRHRLTEALRAAAALDDGQVLQVRYRSSDPVGGHRWLSRRITPFRRDDDGRLVEILSVVRDVSEVIAAEDRLTHAALHDPLTGLPNRTLLTDRLTGALFRARRHHQEVAVLFCDLDGLKRVNDGAGHAVGDKVLVQTGLRLQDCLRAHDTVARFGGDEFVIIVEPLNYDNASDPMLTPRQLGERMAKRIVAALGRPVDIDGTKHTVTVSVGLAFAGGDGEIEVTADHVLRDADAAMYLAKSRGKDRYEVCDSGPT